MTRILFSSLVILSLAACGGGDPQGKTTSKLNAIEIEPGTISDSMIVLDDASVDGTAVDNSVPGDGTEKPAKAEEADGAADTEQADGETTSPTADTKAAPAAKKAGTPAD